MTAFDQRSFRAALGRFATGVTIITARGSNGQLAGVTANSFNSVSLDPPLILWSLAKTSNSLEIFDEASQFAVHILGQDQEHLSNRFATKGVDKFEGIMVAKDGPPLIDGCAVHFLCRTQHRHDVGDHILYIGEVLDFVVRDHAPLLYVQGKYGEARRRDLAGLCYDLDAVKIGEGAILNLFSDAYAEILMHIGAELDELGLTQSATIILGAVAQGHHQVDDVRRYARERGVDFPQMEQDLLCADGLISVDADRIHLTFEGQQRFGGVLAAMQRVEQALIAGLSLGELSEARNFLRHIRAGSPAA